MSCVFDKNSASSWKLLQWPLHKTAQNEEKKFPKKTSYDQDQKTNFLILGQSKCPLFMDHKLQLLIKFNHITPTGTLHRILSLHNYVWGKNHLDRNIQDLITFLKGQKVPHDSVIWMCLLNRNVSLIIGSAINFCYFNKKKSRFRILPELHFDQGGFQELQSICLNIMCGKLLTFKLCIILNCGVHSNVPIIIAQSTFFFIFWLCFIFWPKVFPKLLPQNSGDALEHAEIKVR